MHGLEGATLNSTVPYTQLELGADHVGYVMASPSMGALAVGLTISVIIMGVVTVQLFLYSRRFWKDRRLVVVVVHAVFWCNIIGLVLLITATYNTMLSRFNGRLIDPSVLPRMYTLLMIPNIISRAIMSYSMALLTAGYLQSGILGMLFNVMIASRVGLNAAVLHAIFHSVGSATPSAPKYPQLLQFSTLLSMGTEGIVSALLGRAICQEKKGLGYQNSILGQLTRYAIPSYFMTMAWHIAFAVAVLRHSSFMAATFGIPLGAVSNMTLLALLHVHPSILETSLWGQRVNISHRCLTGVSVSQDVATQSCYDGPLETGLAERLERLFPQEEESRTYHPESEIEETVGKAQTAPVT
ncbi:hypothetical protein DL93DRAFT_498901 [Clavulina sp. PMI_390]|nr:hypothetical protein DL93DRAFT_498901 [Clavulina sp. PMI_390]